MVSLNCANRKKTVERLACSVFLLFKFYTAAAAPALLLYIGYKFSEKSEQVFTSFLQRKKLTRLLFSTRHFFPYFLFAFLSLFAFVCFCCHKAAAALAAAAHHHRLDRLCRLCRVSLCANIILLLLHSFFFFFLI